MSSGAAKAVLRAIRCASELRINGGSAVDAAMQASSSFTRRAAARRPRALRWSHPGNDTSATRGGSYCGTTEARERGVKIYFSSRPLMRTAHRSPTIPHPYRRCVSPRPSQNPQ